jgi:hypothetical protein
MRQFEEFWSNDKRKKHYLSTAVVIFVSVITILVGTKIGYTRYQASFLKHQKGNSTLQNNIGEVKGAATTSDTTSLGSTTSGTQVDKTSTGSKLNGYQTQTDSNSAPTNPSTYYPSINNSADSSDNTSPTYQAPNPDNTRDDQKRIAECIAQNQKRNDVLNPIQEQIYDLQNYYWEIPDLMAEKVKGTFTNQAQLDRMIQAEEQKTQSEINQLQAQYNQLSSQYPQCNS